MNLRALIQRCFSASEAAQLPDPRLDRRSFLKILGGSAAVVAAAPLLDLDRLLWTPTPSIIVPDFEGTWITADWVTREALKVLEHKLSFMQVINWQYDDAFVGPTITIRKPLRFAA